MSTTPSEPPGSGVPSVPTESEGPVFQTAPPPELWRLRDLGFFITFAVFALVVVPFLLLMVYAVLQPLAHWKMTATAAATNPILMVLFQLLSYVMILAFVYVLVTVHYCLPFWAALKWRSPGLRQGLRLFLGGIAMVLASLAVSHFLPDKSPFPLEQLFNSPAAAYTLAAFAIFAAPFMEELIFRGVLFAFFERHGGLRFAVISTTLLFGALHVPEYWGAWTHALIILGVGLICSLVRAITDSLAPSVILHAVFNGSGMVMLFFATDHFRTVQALATLCAG